MISRTILFPEIVERDIKQKVRGATKKEREWILAAMRDEELTAEVNRRKEALVQTNELIATVSAMVMECQRTYKGL